MTTTTPCISQTSSLKNNQAIWEGALWKIFCCASFAGINGIVRYLSGGGSLMPETPLPTNVIMFFQNVFGSLLILPFFFLNRQASQPLFPQKDYGLHFLRVFAAVLGVALWYLTLKNMPIAIGVALTFLSPIFTVLGAKLFLGEAIGKERAFAICFSIIGAFVISRPDHALFGKDIPFSFVYLLPLASALSLVANKLITRKLAAKGETAQSLATYLLLFMTPISLLFALPEWRMPLSYHWPWLILLGLLATFAHCAFSKAYAKAEVIFLTPIGFSKFLFSTLIGYAFFLEIPKLSLWMGMIFIGISVFLLITPLSTYKKLFYKILSYKIFSAYKIFLYSNAKRFRSN